MKGRPRKVQRSDIKKRLQKSWLFQINGWLKVPELIFEICIFAVMLNFNLDMTSVHLYHLARFTGTAHLIFTVFVILAYMWDDGIGDLFFMEVIMMLCSIILLGCIAIFTIINHINVEEDEGYINPANESEVGSEWASYLYAGLCIILAVLFVVDVAFYIKKYKPVY